MNRNLVIIVAIVILAGVTFWLSTQKKASNTMMQPQPTQSLESKSVEPTVSEDSKMTEATEIKVEGGGFYFKPNEIRVKKGEKVEITFTNAGGMHDFVIDDLNVKTDRINAGETATVEFTPDKTGTFPFYCSVGNHSQMGMKGTIIVE